jgi:hypothetical protein
MTTQEQEKKAEEIFSRILETVNYELHNLFWSAIAYGYSEINLGQLTKKINQI